MFHAKGWSPIFDSVLTSIQRNIYMNLKFTGSFEDLKAKLAPLGGQWDESQSNKKILRVEKGVLNWFETTGTLSVQGKTQGKELIERQVPHLLYPAEYPEDKSKLIKDECPEPLAMGNDEIDPSVENLYLTNNFENSELIIGIVSPVGAEYDRVGTPLKDRLRGFGYDVQEIRVSSLLSSPPPGLKEYERIRYYIAAGDKLRKETKNNAILAAGVANEIKKRREGEPSKTVYIINSLKHPDEVEFLRKVYGYGFYLFGIHADEKRRHNHLVEGKLLAEKQASELIRIDEDEKIPHGQRTRDTFHLSDFYISLSNNNDKVKNTIQRFLELLFSHPFRNPTFDEFAMFMAFNSSIRSGDLSRQVGAIIARNCQIIATGANDTPKHGGGQYWAEVDPETGEVGDAPGGKDYKLQEDSNKAAQLEIIQEITDEIMKSSVISEEKRAEIENILKQSKISDLTEFGRVVHAEMEAILSCVREGITTIGATLYCTTFPCHNCAKHIIDAGIARVVYVEPYPKSRALDLHEESIQLKTDDNQKIEDRVIFEPFIGVGARRFLDLFSMSLGSGSKIMRKNRDGSTIEWE